jgi:uncharacterized protein YecT (DUF1311 family)
MIFKPRLFAALLLIAALPAVAQERGRPELAALDSTLQTCLAAAQTSMDYSDCYTTAVNTADTMLNQQWRAVLARYTPQQAGDSWPGQHAQLTRVRARLVAEQRAWVAFKEASCQFYWEPAFGSMHRSIVGPSCRLEIYRSRIGQLQTILDAD